MATSRATEQEKSGKGRKRPIDVERLEWYIRRLGYSKQSFRDALVASRDAERAGVNGPSEKTFGEIFRTERVSDDLYASILRLIKSGLIAGYKEGSLNPAEIPMILDLDMRPGRQEDDANSRLVWEPEVHGNGRIPGLLAEPEVQNIFRLIDSKIGYVTGLVKMTIKVELEFATQFLHAAEDEAVIANMDYCCNLVNYPGRAFDVEN